MIFTEPKAGLPFVAEKILPAQFNNIVDNERAAWWVAVQNRNIVTQTNQYDALVDSDVYWCTTLKLLLVAFNTAVSSNYARLESTSGAHIDEAPVHSNVSKFIGAYEVPASLRLESWPTTAAGGTSMWYSTHSGANWDAWATQAIPNFCATGRPVWLGGANNARIIPGRYSATATETCVMYAAGTSTFTRHNLAFGTDPVRAAADGAGGVVVCSPTHVQVASNYGATLGDWTDVTYPTLASGHATARASIARDTVNGTYIMVRLRTDNQLCFTTSTDGVTWQAWRSIATLNNAPALVDVACINGAWFVQVSDLFAYGYRTPLLWCSIDLGASWVSFGRIETSNTYVPVTVAKLTLTACDDCLVSFRHFDANDFSFTRIGPIDSPTAVSSVVV